MSEIEDLRSEVEELKLRLGAALAIATNCHAAETETIQCNPTVIAVQHLRDNYESVVQERDRLKESETLLRAEIARISVTAWYDYAANFTPENIRTADLTTSLSARVGYEVGRAQSALHDLLNQYKKVELERETAIQLLMQWVALHEREPGRSPIREKTTNFLSNYPKGRNTQVEPRQDEELNRRLATACELLDNWVEDYENADKPLAAKDLLTGGVDIGWVAKRTKETLKLYRKSRK
jgi:hypothetical protein